MTYEEKLQDKRWVFVSWHVRRRDGNRCQECGYSGETPYREAMHHICDPVRYLVVHHKYYTAGCEPWEYPPDALITLCNVCHERGHGIGGLLS